MDAANTVITIGATLTAVTAAGVSLRRLFRFVSKVSVFVEVTAPVILDIAKEFKPNSGHTLKDQITAIQGQASGAKLLAEKAVQDRLIHEQKLNELSNTMDAQFTAVRRSLHQLKKKADLKNLEDKA